MSYKDLANHYSLRLIMSGKVCEGTSSKFSYYGFFFSFY